jgi:hypothetical protein
MDAVGQVIVEELRSRRGDHVTTRRDPIPSHD